MPRWTSHRAIDPRSVSPFRRRKRCREQVLHVREERVHPGDRICGLRLRENLEGGPGRKPVGISGQNVVLIEWDSAWGSFIGVSIPSSGPLG